jgi:hydroxymethylpyrimidine pyrophosphatase-like HAD family hydrolase
MANSTLPPREIEGLHITASNDDDGVARAIEKFILNRESEAS